HVVQSLIAHFALIDRAGDLEQPVRERALAVIDVGNDREVSDVLGIKHGWKSEVGSRKSEGGSQAGVALASEVCQCRRTAVHVRMARHWPTRCALLRCAGQWHPGI